MNVSIIGSGYVGVGTAVGLFNENKVICIDHDKSKVDLINQGISPIFEHGLDERLCDYIQRNGGPFAYCDYQKILGTDVTFISVGTPSLPDGGIDLTCIKSAIHDLGEILSKKATRHVVVVKSTVIPGTTQNIIIPLLEDASGKKVGKDIGVAVNPEFLREGEVLHFSRDPFRIVIGASDEQTSSIVEALYREFSAPMVKTDVTTAEMIKYASNTYLATRLSFINEIGNICKVLGVDVSKVAQGMGYDPRIGDQFLNAGVGFGGSCLPKDLSALISKAKTLNCEAELLQAVSQVNEDQPQKLIEIARKRLGHLENKTIAVLGLAFKANTNDIRQAPAMKIIAQLLSEKVIVRAYDPQAIPPAKQIFHASDVQFCSSISEAIMSVDCVMIITEWDEFKNENLYSGKLVLDGRRVLDPQKAKSVCDYEGICW